MTMTNFIVGVMTGVLLIVLSGTVQRSLNIRLAA